MSGLVFPDGCPRDFKCSFPWWRHWMYHTRPWTCPRCGERWIAKSNWEGIRIRAVGLDPQQEAKDE